MNLGPARCDEQALILHGRRVVNLALRSWLTLPQGCSTWSNTNLSPCSLTPTFISSYGAALVMGERASTPSPWSTGHTGNEERVSVPTALLTSD